MGNSVSGLPYEEGERVEFRSHLFDLSAGSKKTEEKDPVLIFKFKFKKSAANGRDLAIAQRSLTKLRSLKHPYILSFIDSIDSEEDLILVTETAVPLETWLQRQLDAKVTPNDIFQEINWGFRCLLMALDFLHNQGTMTHSYVCLESIYVCPNGDWKLGSMELSCKAGNFEDESFLRAHNQYLDRDYLPPERDRFDDLTIQRAKGAIDIYSAAVCMQKVFNKLVDTPPQYTKYLKAMLRSEIERRPKATQILKSDIFKFEHIALMDKVAEMHTKSNTELCEVLGLLSASDPTTISGFLVNAKIAPALAHIYKVAIKDFAIREAREMCRRLITQATSLLSNFVELGKIDAACFEKRFVDAFVALWSFSDRAVRTCLLVTLKNLITLMPDGVVSKHLFDPMLAGFADSNAKLREETLKSLVFVLDKLEEIQIRDKLLRSISTLQNDQEASLRTNATIFLGKLSGRVTEEVRHRAIYPGFGKAMKDPFVHCRIAGLKSVLSCMDLIDRKFLATKLLPQVCGLVVDPNAAVRELAMNVLTESMSGMQELHLEMKREAAVKEAERERLGVAEKERNHALGNGGGSAMPPVGPSGSGTEVHGGGGYSRPDQGRSISNSSLGSAGSAGYGSGSSYESGGRGLSQDYGNGAGSRNTSMDASAIDAGVNLSMKLAQDEIGGGVKGMSLPVVANDGWGDDDLDFDDSPAQKPMRAQGVGNGSNVDDLGALMSEGFNSSSGGGKLKGMSLSQGSSKGSGGYGAPSATSYAPPQQAQADPFADIGLPTGPAVTKAGASPTKKGRVRGQRLAPKHKDEGDWDDF